MTTLNTNQFLPPNFLSPAQLSRLSLNAIIIDDFGGPQSAEVSPNVLDSVFHRADAEVLLSHLVYSEKDRRGILPDKIHVVSSAEKIGELRMNLRDKLPPHNISIPKEDETPFLAAMAAAKRAISFDRNTIFVIAEAGRVVWDRWLLRRCLVDAATVANFSSGIVCMGIDARCMDGDIVETGPEIDEGGFRARGVKLDCDAEKVRKHLKRGERAFYLSSGIFVCSGSVLLKSFAEAGGELLLSRVIQFREFLTRLEPKQLGIYPLDYGDIVRLCRNRVERYRGRPVGYRAHAKHTKKTPNADQ